MTDAPSVSTVPRDRFYAVLSDPTDTAFDEWTAERGRRAEELAAEVDRLMPGFVVDLGIFNVRRRPWPCLGCGVLVVLVLTWEQELTAAGLAERLGPDGRGSVEDLPRHAPSRCRAFRAAARAELADLDQLSCRADRAEAVHRFRGARRLTSSTETWPVVVRRDSAHNITRPVPPPGVSPYSWNTKLI
jgi:hypothetical protein